MRQVDHEEPQPLGRKIEPPAPDPQPEWRPSGTPGFERNSDGQLRSVPQPLPPEAL